MKKPNLSEEELKKLIRNIVEELLSEREKQKQSKCELVITETSSGDFIVCPRGDYTDDYIEKAKAKIKERGLVFLK
ncbi:MAG: hypothetical protein QW156_04635 [Candidatus Aenigmatarchaeota archaeon]